MKIIFFGTPQFAADVLTFLLKNKVEIVAVVSKPDRPQGRSKTPIPTPVKQAALAFNSLLPIHQPEIVSTEDFATILKSYEADFFVVAAYGEIIKQFLLDIPKIACINLHTSLLPKFRGAAPIQRAIMSGEKESGITVIHMVKKMDAGEMIRKIQVPIDPDMTFGELEDALCLAGKKALLEIIQNFHFYNQKRLPQEEALVSFAPKIELEDCEINWSDSSEKIHNLVRGVNPYPGAWCYVLVKGERKRLKINRTRLISEKEKRDPGTILNENSKKGNFLLACGEGVLELLDVQLEGKKMMSSEELTRGIPKKIFQFNLTISN